MSVVFSRVDGRMIHGQVAIAWTRLLQIDELLVINDEVAEDDTQIMLLELAVPSGMDLTICSVAEAAEKIINDEFSGNRTMIIYKTLSDAVRIMEKGINVGPINIGGMYHKEGKTQYAKALCLDDNDIAGIRKLKNNNVELFYQVAPMNEKEDLEKLITNL